MCHVSELLVPGFGCPVLLCRVGQDASGPWDGRAYVRDGYGAFHQPKFECGCCEMLVFRVCGMRQNLYFHSLYCKHQWLPCRLRMSVPLSCLWVIWMAIIRSGWVLRPRTVMELQPLTLQQSPVAISWSSAKPMLMVEHLTSW